MFCKIDGAKINGAGEKNYFIAISLSEFSCTLFCSRSTNLFCKEPDSKYGPKGKLEILCWYFITRKKQISINFVLTKYNNN